MEGMIGDRSTYLFDAKNRSSGRPEMIRWRRVEVGTSTNLFGPALRAGSIFSFGLARARGLYLLSPFECSHS
ncbi:hypothetical protein MA16_Dca005250 [Dendrobium catenatum]|uniref:Uncharacterized protein n=1 Tax=Dendrobium catenatum TaxID=906689 RepID=A0A2I0VLN9_9ASPA|nr:hypothetical protein MA16_Dca005250 [Dendrobium catenatum]